MCVRARVFVDVRTNSLRTNEKLRKFYSPFKNYESDFLGDKNT